jgi:hypothetical protein
MGSYHFLATDGAPMNTDKNRRKDRRDHKDHKTKFLVLVQFESCIPWHGRLGRVQAP